MSVAHVVDEVDATGILGALSQNGSLHRFSYSAAFSDDQSRMVESYCARNKRLLPEVLAKLGCDDDEKASTAPSEVPDLLCTATQTPLFAPTNVVAGLLALDDTLCPSLDVKRLR